MRLLQYYIVLVVFCSTSIALGADLLPNSDKDVTETIQIAIPEDLSSNDIGDFVVPLDETQVRSLLIDNLRTDALSNQQTSLDTAPSIMI